MIPDETAPADEATLPEEDNTPVVFPFETDVVEEISTKVHRWETSMSSMLSKFNEYANFFRQIREPIKDKREGFSDAVTGETTRATRALATMMFRMMTSADPNFYFLATSDQVTPEQIEDAETLQMIQEVRLQKRRYLLKGCYTMALFGTVPFEEPWVQDNRGGRMRWEGTGFYPRSLAQVAFDHSVPEIEMSDWHAIIDFVSPGRMRTIARANPEIWDMDKIEEAIEASGDKAKLPELVRQRRTRAGYTDAGGPVLQLTTYYGSLDKEENEEGKDWVIGTLNDTHLVRGHALSQESGIRPVRFAHYVEHELEPYGYGVGQFGRSLQLDMNANRRRMVNIATFALYHMWKMGRLAGIKPSQLRIRPWGAVEMDDIEQLEPLRPDLNAFNVGKMLEDLLKEEFRANTGATANLQAIVTEATASESSIAQNEAVRNISVQTEIAAEQMIRQHLMISHENNLQYLDGPIWLNWTGRAKPKKLFRGDLARDVEPYVRITTDKDFRPERIRRMIEALQTISSVRNQLPPEAVVTLMPLVEEIMHGLNVKFSSVIKMPTAMEQLQAKIAQAAQLREAALAQGGGGGAPGNPASVPGSDVDGAAAGGNGIGGSPKDMPGGAAVLNTPVGPVLASPQ
jgi:hypothetical protein